MTINWFARYFGRLMCYIVLYHIFKRDKAKLRILEEKNTLASEILLYFWISKSDNITLSKDEYFIYMTQHGEANFYCQKIIFTNENCKISG